MADCDFSLFSCVFLYFLDDLSLVEAQVVVNLTLAVAGLGFEEGAEVISFEIFVL